MAEPSPVEPAASSRVDASARKGSSLRGRILVAFGFLSFALLFAASALGFVAYRFHQTNDSVRHDVEALRLAESLETAVLLHEREWVLSRGVGSSAYTPSMAEVETKLRRELEEAQDIAGSPAEHALVTRLGRRVSAYFEAQRSADARRLPLGRAIVATGPAFDELLVDLDALQSLNVREARSAYVRAERRDRVAIALAIAVAVLALIALAVNVLEVELRVTRPLAALRAAILRFDRGDRAARAPVTGPREIREIGQAFNAMAARLVRQGESQLAFLGGIAHDLRGPLAVIKSSAGLLAREDAFGGRTDVRRTVQVLDRQTQRLERMVGDFLDAARIQAGKLELRRDRLDLRDLVRDTVEAFRPLSTIHDLQITIEDDPVVVDADPVRIEQVLSNLLSNAIKYSPRGGVVAVSLAEDRRTGEAVLAIEDEGIGIAPDDVPRIFEPFRRSGASRETIPGVGLGLSVARRIVEGHGGTIEVESERSRGSTFVVRLPLAERPSAAAGERMTVH